MILQALVDYYEELAKRNEIARPGWGSVKVSFALELDESGALARIVPLLTEKVVGKKNVLAPREMKLPAPVTRTVGIASNFLWDNCSYLLGFDGKGKPERAKECFAAAKGLHLLLLSDVDDPFARAICGFFESWDPDKAAADSAFEDCFDDIQKGANLVFRFEGKLPDENGALCRTWQTHYDGEEDGETMRCLVTGEEVVPAKIHPAIKNVMGAQSSGAALVSFNASAFCSYEREQNLNAPVGKYAAFAYTTALNVLLADKNHVRRFGDTTVVFWAENAEPAYQTAFAGFLDGGGDKLTNDELQSCMDALAKGECPNFDGVQLHPENRFYILGLAPNAARLSVRFFLRDSFRNFAGNVQKHYERMKVIPIANAELKPLYPFAMFKETVNAKASNPSPSPQMVADTMKAILMDGRYPETLYQQAMLRLRASQDGKDSKNRPVYKISTGRVQIIKAFLVKNRGMRIEEDLNMDDCSKAHNLGRLFCLLESIQREANPKLNTTIKDRYFNSASTTPYIAFSTLMRLKNNHIKVIARDKPKLAEYFENQIAEVCGPIGEQFPHLLSLEEQGAFVLGYYHQRASKKGKDEADAAETIKEEN